MSSAGATKQYDWVLHISPYSKGHARPMNQSVNLMVQRTTSIRITSPISLWAKAWLSQKMPHLISRDAGMRKCIKDHSLSCPAQQPAPASTPSEITKELFHMERKNHQTSIWNIDYQPENHYIHVHFAPSESEDFRKKKVQSPSTQWDCSARAFQWATGGAPCWNLAMGCHGHAGFVAPHVQGFTTNHIQKMMIMSLDWFSRENLNRKPWFLPSNIGLSG